jgi:hypothetical protein
MPKNTRPLYFNDGSAEFRRLAKKRDEASHGESSVAVLVMVAAAVSVAAIIPLP